MKTLLLLSLVAVFCLMIVPAAYAAQEHYTFFPDGSYAVTTVKVSGSVSKPSDIEMLGTVITGSGQRYPKTAGEGWVKLYTKVYTLLGDLMFTVRTGNYWIWKSGRVVSTAWKLPTMEVADWSLGHFTMTYAKGPAFWITYLNNPYGCRYKSMHMTVEQSILKYGVLGQWQIFHEYWLRGDGSYKWRITF